MKIQKERLVNLNQKIPPLQEDKEGKLRGGFNPFESNVSIDAYYENLNCPSGKDSTCYAEPGNQNYINVNCPTNGATCGTTKSTEPGGNGPNGINLGSSSLI